MSTGPYQRPTWSFQNVECPTANNGQPVPGAFADTNVPADSTAPLEDQHNPDRNELPPRQRHYKPRTCRICLEVVQPTYEIPLEGLARFLDSTPKVSYVSQDPESGRLIRPCKCKGSQRYVHEGCLQEWRHADPRYSRRNYWECPTCHFRYRLERMKWSRWISSAVTQIVLTIFILAATVFLLGFVADPILNLYLDPLGTLTTNPLSRGENYSLYEDEEATWFEHIFKGVASLGLLGFIKAIFVMGPWNWWQLRQTGLLGGAGRNGRAATGRDRMENLNIWLIAIGVITFLVAVWKGVRAWSRRTLEKAGERVADVQGDDDADDIDADG